MATGVLYLLKFTTLCKLFVICIINMGMWLEFFSALSAVNCRRSASQWTFSFKSSNWLFCRCSSARLKSSRFFFITAPTSVCFLTYPTPRLTVETLRVVAWLLLFSTFVPCFLPHLLRLSRSCCLFSCHAILS